VKAEELVAVEKHFGFQLPPNYKEDILRVGLPSPTIALLDAISDGNVDLHDASNFLSPAEIIETTEGWQEIGMPEDLIAFATDCMGNMFAFSRSAGAESGVWFFDHDFNETSEISDDFRSWIEDFCNVKPSPNTDLS
jgi:hypothetical protein